MKTAAVLWYRMHVPRRVMPLVVAVPLAASLVAGTSVLLPITGTEFPLRLITPAVVAALAAGLLFEPSANIARTCPHSQVGFRLAWSLCVVLSVLLLHLPFGYVLDRPSGVVVIRDSLLSMGIVLIMTVLGPALFAWSAPIAYTSLVAFNARMLDQLGLIDTVGIPLADADSVPAWLVTACLISTGLATYAVFGPTDRPAADDVS